MRWLLLSLSSLALATAQCCYQGISISGQPQMWCFQGQQTSLNNNVCTCTPSGVPCYTSQPSCETACSSVPPPPPPPPPDCSALVQSSLWDCSDFGSCLVKFGGGQERSFGRWCGSDCLTTLSFTSTGGPFTVLYVDRPNYDLWRTGGYYYSFEESLPDKTACIVGHSASYTNLYVGEIFLIFRCTNLIADCNLYYTFENCSRSCASRNCGDDSCGGVCGTCTGQDTCVDGTCTTPCTPNCNNRVCGDDSCGGTCGSCTGPASW